MEEISICFSTLIVYIGRTDRLFLFTTLHLNMPKLLRNNMKDGSLSDLTDITWKTSSKRAICVAVTRRTRTKAGASERGRQRKRELERKREKWKKNAHQSSLFLPRRGKSTTNKQSTQHANRWTEAKKMHFANERYFTWMKLYVAKTFLHANRLKSKTCKWCKKKIA